jgi:hypothetical protein
MKVKTRAAMEWLDKQVEAAKAGGEMTTIKIRENGRLDEGIVAEHFSRNGFDVNIGNGCVHVTPRAKSHGYKKIDA